MSSGELVGHFPPHAKPSTPLQSDGAWASPMISVVDPLPPGSACRPLWPVTSPRSGRAAPRSARLAGPSRSVTLGQRQRSPSSQHHQGGAGERSCWPRSGRPEGPPRCRQPSRPAGAGRRGAAGGPPWSRRPGRRRLTEPPRPPARPAPGSDRPGGSGRSGPARSASCSAEGGGGSIGMGVASLMRPAYRPLNLVPTQLRTIVQVMAAQIRR
jgi:hypothetical protein